MFDAIDDVAQLCGSAELSLEGAGQLLDDLITSHLPAKQVGTWE